MVIETVPPELVGTGLDSLYLLVQPFFKRLSLFVGGIFGLYLILILVRVYYERRKVKLLQAIRYDLDRLNMHYEIGYSTQKKGWFRKAFRSVKSRAQEKKVERGFRKLEKNKK